MKFLCRNLRNIFRLLRKIGFRMQAVYYANIFSACGKNIRIASNVTFSCPKNISFGNCVSINSQTIFFGKGGIEIGDNVFISAGVKILSSTLDLRGECVTRRHVHKKVTIGSNVGIGAGVVILPGVTIGDNVMIGAGAIVTKDLPGNCVCAGIPAKVVRTFTVSDKP